jgi:drug/metabolite transporter (DMT)-like permease
VQLRRTLAIFSVVCLMAVWGSTFAVTKATARDFPPLTLAFLRFFLASVALAPLALARGGLRQLPRPLPFGRLILMALTGIALFTVAFNYALVYGSAAQGAIIYAGLPAAIALAARMFLGERLSQRRIAGIVLSVIGVALIASAGERDQSSPQPWLGALAMLGAVVAFAAYTVTAKQLAGCDSVVTTACMSAIGALLLAPLSAAELRGSDWHWTTPSASGWLGLAFLAVVASALAYVVFARALRELDASLIGALANLDPVVGMIVAVVFLGEVMLPGQIGGGAIAFVGMWLASKQDEAARGERTQPLTCA